MTSSASTMTFAPHQPSPLARTISPFKDPRPPPCTPGQTAKLWDEYERRAIENAKQRDRIMMASIPQRSSAGDVRKSHESTSATTTTRSSFDFKSKGSHVATPSTTVALCKTCKRPITYASGICERCKKTIVLPTPSGETTPPLSPSSRNFAASDLRQLHASLSQFNKPISTSPKRRSFCPLPTQLMDPPIRLSSLQPPPTTVNISDPARSRKASLTDPNEPFLRLQIIQQHNTYQPTRSASHPSTPTTMTAPLTPPSTSHSHSSTRPSSLANIAQLPVSYARNNSATPSEISALYPYATASTAPTSPPSLCRSSYALQNQTSAWDDWDSEGEEEKIGLVGWMGRRKGRKGKASMESADSREGATSSRGKEKKRSTEDERLERARCETAESARVSRSSMQEPKKSKRPSGFVRVISCGCSQE